MAVFPLEKKPLNFGGLVLWLDANDPAGNNTQPADNSSLATWVDKSGQKNNAAQGTGASQPLFKTNMQAGLPAIRFDGSNDFMNTANTLTVADNTIFVVNKILTIADTRLLYWYNGSGQGFYYTNSASGVAAAVTFFSPVSVSPNNAVESNFYITSFKRESTTASLYRDGTLQSSDACNSGNIVSYLTVGADYTGASAGNNDICEVLVYRRALNSNELTVITNYLKNKWGIA